MKGRYFAVPLLFAAHPVLFLYAHNLGEMRFSEALPSLLGSLGFALIVLLIAWRLVKDRTKAVLVASVLVVVCLSYGHASAALFAPRAGSASSLVDLLLSPVACVLALCLAQFIAEGRGDQRPLLNASVIAAVALAVVPLLQAAPQPQQLGRKSVALPQVSAAELKVDANAPAVKGPPPDIYYIVPDRYYGPEATEAVLDFDNHEFLGWLERKGFYVARKSRANYARTCLSLSSSLNMVYLTDLVSQLGRNSRDETPTYEMIRDNTVQRFLKARGYRYFHAGAWWEPTRTNPHADFVLGAAFFSQFSQLFLEGTVARPFLSYVGLVPDQMTRHREGTLHQLEELRDVPGRPGPKFVFVHLLLPHPPWVFGANGDPVAFDETSDNQERHCREQIQYANTRLTELIENILAHSKRPPLIVLQADEGMEWGSPSGREIRVGMVALGSGDLHHSSILNAYYLPGLDPSELYPTITPVNSFRLIFNHYFGTRLARLPDESWLIASPLRPYDQTNITEYVR